jgi:hypothetical protein
VLLELVLVETFGLDVVLVEVDVRGRLHGLRLVAGLAEERRELHREAARYAAAISSSGFVPSPLSKREANE